MKNIWIAISLLIVECLCLFGVYYTEKNNNSQVYPLTVEIVELDRDSDIVTGVDGAGNFWEFYGVEDWETGDFASLLMNDNGTQSIYDDTIEIIRYAGHWDF